MFVSRDASEELMNQRIRTALVAVVTFAAFFLGVPLGAQAYSPGNGVTAPRVVRSVPMPRPASEVILECVIEPDGALGKTTVIRAADADVAAEVQQAVAHWQFEAGTKDGAPVSAVSQGSMSRTSEFVRPGSLRWRVRQPHARA